MNGTRAKRIRRTVYGDQSLRHPRKYRRIVRRYWDGNPITQTINEPGSLRAIYQQVKRGTTGVEA